MLKNAVNGKRYLLVLDDVWNRDEHKWEKLKSYLQLGGSGSSVLTTTRDEAVANLMMGRSTTYAQNLKNLDEVYIREIIGTRAFGSKQEEEWPPEILGMVGDMVKRCSGSPLAATALGSVLHTKTSKKEWEDLLSRSTICDEENGILPVLKLSYNCLPSYMRQCFAFCAMFPKDYEIDVHMLIQLWMANGFIPEQPKVCPETIAERIFKELKSRSFFQDLKIVPFFDQKHSIFEGSNMHRYSRITCKIHDLMHDVAQSTMANECASVATCPSETEDVLHSARHLYLSVYQPETFLNASLEKGPPAFQTLICYGYIEEDMKILSKYNSIRALKIREGSFLIRPKYLHHLRYLDLSESDIQALPEDISILYHLQTLNLSGCHYLQRLPKELKYLIALRHLYTHGCWELKSMPTGLGRLNSLQTLTLFVVGTDSRCSSVGELQNLNLGGKLELSQLENVTGADAKAAGLRNKEKLTELELKWTDSDQEAQNNHEEVVEGLKPHDGLKVLRIYFCGSRTFPTWMDTLRGMVELELCDCKKVKKLTALWQLPALQILRLKGLESLQCLCSGGITPVAFQKLEVLDLYKMPNFEAWWDTDELQGEEPIFPRVEELKIQECGSLTALPKAASVIMESSGGVDTIMCRSAFPALREMKLYKLTMFDQWDAVEGTIGEEVMFPRLEKLSILSCGSLSALPKGSLVKQSFGRAETVYLRSAFPALRKLSLSDLPTLERWGAVNGTQGEDAVFPQLEELYIGSCGNLSALPKGSLLVKQSFGGPETEHCRSAFPALRILRLRGLSALDRWGSIEGTPGDQVTYPLLENLEIDDCPKLTNLPEAPKLSKLSIQGDDQQISLQAASRYIPSLSSLTLDASPNGRWLEPDARQRPDREVPLPAMWLSSCNLLFSSHSIALVLRIYFAQLVDLEIWKCDALDYWPENVFQVLVCLRNLSIVKCSKLTGCTRASDEQSAPAPERGGLLPCLEYLDIEDCASLVEVPNPPASLKTLRISRCSNNVRSIIFGQPEDASSLIPGCSSGEATASTAVLKLSSAANHRFLPCLESLLIERCRGLSEVTNLPPSIKKLFIMECCNLQSLSGQLDAIKDLSIFSCSRLESLESFLGELRSLEELCLFSCKSLVSLPDGPQMYSSLRVLCIKCCDGMKLLPPSLQSRLDYLEEKDLDDHLEGPDLPEPKTLRCAIRSLVCLK
ncbi:unnamed protein product [Urochloa humidicola]